VLVTDSVRACIVCSLSYATGSLLYTAVVCARWGGTPAWQCAARSGGRRRPGGDRPSAFNTRGPENINQISFNVRMCWRGAL